MDLFLLILVTAVGMVSSSEAEGPNELDPTFIAMYDLLTFSFKDVSLLEEVDTVLCLEEVDTVLPFEEVGSKLLSKQDEKAVIKVAFFFGLLPAFWFFFSSLSHFLLSLSSSSSSSFYPFFSE